MSPPRPPRTYGIQRKAVYSKHIPNSTTRLAGGDNCPGCFTFHCAYDGLRSHYLLCIRQVLYQLSYISVADLVGLEPTIFCLTGSSLYHLSFRSLCTDDGIRTHNLDDISVLLSPLSYISICASRWSRTTRVIMTADLQSAPLPSTVYTGICAPYRTRTYDILHVKQTLYQLS